MAANIPLIYGPDGKLRQTVEFSVSEYTLQTSAVSRFFSGTLPLSAVEVQVSINGSGFSADETLILWGDGAWTVPNPNYDPDGLELLNGENTVEVRAVLPSGTTTGSASAVVRLTTAASNIEVEAPTNVSVEQKSLEVVVQAEGPEDSTYLQGFNFYASREAGGGAEGYTRINVNRVGDPVVSQELSEFADQTVEVAVKVDANGNPVGDPLFMRLRASQQYYTVDEETGPQWVTAQEDYDERYEIPETARTVRLTNTLSEVRDAVVYRFAHNRSAGPTSTPATVRVTAFANLPFDQPLYYVVTAIYFDPATNVEYESAFSAEVVAHPMVVTTAIGSIPTVNRQTIITQFIQGIFRSNPQIKVEAGSVLRDTVIDPFSTESERLRFLLDFYQRARTPTLLLQIDDPTGSGTSVPVGGSTYKQALKQALYLTTDQETQALIDSAFEAYASNFGMLRRTGVAAQGEVLFYTTKRPTASLLLPLGTVVSGGSVPFSTTREQQIPLSQIASFYNPSTGAYQVSVPVQANLTGSVTNVGAGQVKTIVTALSGSFSVTNINAMVGGQDRESNLDLTARVQNRLASVDSGTERGYLQTAADVPGVVKANVVAAGNPLMQRDLNAEGVHKGGKVDVWVQGENEATITDTFAFTFEIGQDIQFEVLGDVADLRFRAVDPTLSQSDPIVEMLDDPAVGYELRNASTGEVFNLTGVVIDSYNTIQLDTSVVQPRVDLTDVILGSYRRRTGTAFVLPRQPVSAITSVVGNVSGTLPTDSYLLVHPNAPLEMGRSTLAGDFLQVTGYTDSTGARIPSGDTLTVTDESHVLLGQYAEFLNFLGANYLTVVVKSADGLITYAGPTDPSGDPDYTISLGGQTTAVSITRTSGSAIPSGATVLVSYEHDENFSVTYTTNLITSLTQNALDKHKHATADVVAKEALATPLDIDATVVVKQGRESSSVDTALRSNLSNFFNNLRLGDPVRQSDIIDVIERTAGVSYVVVPLTKMVRQAGSTVVREELSTDTVSESVFLSSLTTNAAVVFILTQELSAATLDGGGVAGEFKAVFQDDMALNLLEASSVLPSLGTAPGQAYVVGAGGRSIQGYSDEATLISQGYVTPAAIQARQKELTANRVLVSLSPGDAPTEHAYALTYVVAEGSGALNIDPGGAEFATEGTFVFTYDEDQ